MAAALNLFVPIPAWLIAIPVPDAWGLARAQAKAAWSMRF
jgi:hypothetical protein